MKRLIISGLLFFLVKDSQGQTVDIKSMVDSLRYLKGDTITCKSDLYWRIIAQGKKAIPFLIDKLDDTTHTTISFRCKKKKLNVGEVAYFALEQIVSWPTFVITQIQFDYNDERGCWIFFEYLFDNKNKVRYQSAVRTWYNKNKNKFREERIQVKDQSECQRLFKIDRYLRWRE